MSESTGDRPAWCWPFGGEVPHWWPTPADEPSRPMNPPGYTPLIVDPAARIYSAALDAVLRRVLPVNVPVSDYGFTVVTLDADGNVTIKVNQFPSEESK